MDLPLYLPITFIATVLVSFLLFSQASLFDKKTIYVLLAWLGIQSILSGIGFYQDMLSLPPKIMVLGVLPTILLIIFFLVKKYDWIKTINLKQLHWLHIVRIPVEFCLLWLYQGGVLAKIQTFEGTNIDILMGITAPIIIYFGFKNGIHKKLLIVWNVIGIILLSNIVITSVFCFPTPFQQLSLDQPAIAMAYFPYSLLPVFIVPLVYFAHFASIKRLMRNDY